MHHRFYSASLTSDAGTLEIARVVRRDLLLERIGIALDALNHGEEITLEIGRIHDNAPDGPVSEAGAMSTSDGIGAADDHEIYDVEIVGPDDDPLGIIHGIAAASPEAACDAPQVGQYLEQIREERPDATVGRVTRS